MKSGTIQLETERLILRKFMKEDIEQSYINWASDPNASRYFANFPHKHKCDTENMINQWVQSYHDKCTYIWAIELKITGEVIGNICIDTPLITLEIGEIAYVIGSKWWNQGFATEALKTVLNYLFCQENFYLIEAKYNITNVASEKVLHKLGMKQDGILRDRRFDKDTGIRNDLVICSILKGEYLNEKI